MPGARTLVSLLLGLACTCLVAYQVADLLLKYRAREASVAISKVGDQLTNWVFVFPNSLHPALNFFEERANNCGWKLWKEILLFFQVMDPDLKFPTVIVCPEPGYNKMVVEDELGLGENFWQLPG